jgi:hypothetical protein
MWSGGEVQEWLNTLPPLFAMPKTREPLSEVTIEALWESSDDCFLADRVTKFARAIEKYTK